MLNTEEAAARYEPRPSDAPVEIFAGRLKACEACDRRANLACRAAVDQLCTILARRRDQRCPERRWPGEEQKTRIEAGGSKIETEQRPNWLARLRSLVTRARPASSRQPRSSVSIVIAARNYARYLPEAIESALRQTVPCEVIYSDDASQDDSISLARTFEDRGLIVLESPVHRGVASARRRGFAVARGDWFLNLDGDDILPDNYVARMLAAVKPDTPFAYGAAQAFGLETQLWQPVDWGVQSLWLRNFVNTSALYSRTVYHAAGGWEEGIGTMWDWDLALRAMRFGRPRRSTAVLQYRQHAASFGHSYQETESEADLMPHLARMRRRLARLSVGSVLSGRLPEIFPDWFDRVARAVRQIRSPWPVDLVLLNHATDRLFTAAVRRVVEQHADTFDTIRILPAGPPLAWSNEPARRDAVARFMAASCNRLKSEMRGDVHWIVEDDVLVPLNGGERLWAAMTAGLRPPEAVSGIYRNRHVPRQMVGGWWQSAGPVETDVGETPEERAAFLAQWRKKSPAIMDFVPTGCLMYWADRVPAWKSHFKGIPAHDWAWSLEIKRLGGQVWLLPEVPCGHAVDEETILDWSK